jgi:hypothetical protein
MTCARPIIRYHVTDTPEPTERQQSPQETQTNVYFVPEI